MNRGFIAGMIVVALLIAGIFYFEKPSVHIGANINSAPDEVHANTTASSSQPSQVPEGKTVTATPKNSPMFFESVEIDTAETPPRACLQFSETVPVTQDVHFKDYLTITPRADVSYQAAGRQVCLTGLTYGTNYSVIIAAGFPAANGDRTVNATTASITFGDAPASVDFADSGFILPRDNVEGVAIDTVNVAEVDVDITRISDRALALGKILGITLGETSEDDATGNQAALPVWTGHMDIANEKNKHVLTAIPLQKIVDRSKPGAYRVKVSDADQDTDENSDDTDDTTTHHVHKKRPHHLRFGQEIGTETTERWILNTDLALTTMAGTDGLHVFVRSINSAKAISGAKVSLISGGNEELGSAETDGDGQVVFAPGLMRGKGAAAAHAVMAYIGDDFTFIKLDRPGFDLSDRGVEGRAQPGAIDAFLYTDRGIYRPGETVQLTTLLRNNLGNATDALPIEISFCRPDGVESFHGKATPNEIGMMALAIPVSPTAPRGTWSIVATTPGNKTQLGSLTVEVQDFVPQRLKVKLSSDAKIAIAGQPLAINVDGRYLYGAPAAELTAEGEAKLTVDPAPLPALKDYHFGMVTDTFETQTIPFDSAQSDANGHAQLTITPTEISTSLPIKLDITAGLTEPGGRVTEDEISLPLQTSPLLIGIKPTFAAAYVREGTDAGFQIIARHPDGTSPDQLKLHYRVVKEQENFGYYLLDNNWSWRTLEHDEPVAEGTLDVTGDAATIVHSKADWGTYRLELDDPISKARSSVRFHGGYYASTSIDDSPEKAQVNLLGGQPKPGDTIHVQIKPPFAGEAVITIASDQVFLTKSISVPADGATIDLPTSADWGAGAYVIATVYRPQSLIKGLEPVRALGLTWVALDQSARTMAVQLTVPDKILPRQEFSLPVTVTNIPSGETAYLTLAAVDEGILQLTKFTSPDANDYFFGKRLLSETIRDDYGHLLDGNAAKAGEMREGGDEIGGVGLSVVPTRTVALFSGPVKLDSGGKATIKLQIPDFNGQLRLMAVVASKTALGHGESALTIRDPVVGEVSLPRFLAPNDDATLTLLVNNVDAVAGIYHVKLTEADAVAASAPLERDYDLTQGAQKIDTFPIKGNAVGIGKVSLTLTGPNGYHIDRDWQIEVRGASYPLAVAQKGTQGPNEAFTVEPFAGFVPGSGTTAVNYSRLPGVDLPGMLDELELYPYGCSEQLTSVAFPLVFYNKLMRATGKPEDADTHNRVQDTIGKLLDRQDATGRFGLWREGDDQSGPWLNVYIVDFLQRAKEEGYIVPQEALDRSYSLMSTIAHKQDYSFSEVSYWYLADWVKQLEENRSAAYAMFVLARAGQIEIGDARYLYDTQTNTIDGLSRAELGAALGILGDKARANQAFDAAEAWATVSKNDKRYLFWETALTEEATIVSLAAESGDVDRSRRLADKLQSFDLRPDKMNTQELAWVSIATASLIKDSRPIALEIANHATPAAGTTVTLKPTDADLKAGYKITNTLGDAIFRTVVYRGVPVTPPPAIEAGYKIRKTITRLDGQPIDMGQVKQNDRLVIEVSGNATDLAYHQSVIVDMLPAGFEIESALKPTKGSQVDGYDWLGPVSATKIAEARDDRFVAAVDLEDKDRQPHYGYGDDENNPAPVDMGESFNVAYVVRAVTPGKFSLPAAVVEDLYKPEQTARTAVQAVTIAPAQ